MKIIDNLIEKVTNHINKNMYWERYGKYSDSNESKLHTYLYSHRVKKIHVKRAIEETYSEEERSQLCFRLMVANEEKLTNELTNEIAPKIAINLAYITHKSAGFKLEYKSSFELRTLK